MICLVPGMYQGFHGWRVRYRSGHVVLGNWLYKFYLCRPGLVPKPTKPPVTKKTKPPMTKETMIPTTKPPLTKETKLPVTKPPMTKPLMTEPQKTKKPK